MCLPTPTHTHTFNSGTALNELLKIYEDYIRANSIKIKLVDRK